jgi:hypothetical protein
MFDSCRIQRILACSLISSYYCPQIHQFVAIISTGTPPPPPRHVRTPQKVADIGISLAILFNIFQDTGGNMQALFLCVLLCQVWISPGVLASRQAIKEPTSRHKSQVKQEDQSCLIY